MRLEGGLCLYGNDIDETTSPVEAALGWSIQKTRREKGGFPGAARIIQELKAGPGRIRVGLSPQGRAPVRAGARVFAAEGSVSPIGNVTSGGFGPAVDRPIAMGYVPSEYSKICLELFVDLRGQRIKTTVCALPFIPNRYKR